ncbi:unnamed protein product [Spirodela intermedia]|uniref:Uncharacterized protein n=1 Tax=Spirodela intermedia TaxID=51605 RepID=A0A7I8KNX7_SPIIN|nr:unnamed protein product [Spirodela intermedia]
MVRLVFRPYTQVRRTICTSVSLRASTRVSSGFAPLRHSSPSFGSRRPCSTRTLLRRSGSAGGAPLGGGSRRSVSLRLAGFRTRRLARTSDSSVRVSRRVGWGARRPSPGARGCPTPAKEGGHAETARAASPGRRRRHLRGRTLRPGLRRRRDPRRSAPRAERRTGFPPFRIRPGRTAGPHPLPSRQFQALFDSLFKVLFIFPSRYLFAIGLSPVFSLGRNLPPDWGCIPKQPDSPTAPRAAPGSGRDGALTLSGAPFQGTCARSVAEDASTDYNSGGGAARFSSWAVPGSLAVTRGILVSFFSSAYLYA